MPVTQFNMKWVEPAGLVKFDFLGLTTLTVLDRRGQAGAAARHRHRSVRSAARRRQDLRNAGARRDRRRVPGGKCGHAAGADRHASGSLRGLDRAGGALSAGADGEHPDLLRAQARPRDAPIICIPKLEPILRRYLRHHHLSGAGAADRAGSCRLFARRSRSPAPRHGQEDRSEMEAQRERFVSGAVERGIGRNDADVDLRGVREVRRIRLQQIAFGALRAAHLSDRLHEGELPGRVPRRLDDARHGQHRQARRIPRRGRAARHQGRAAVDQSLRASNSTSTATPSTTRWRRCAASAVRRSRHRSRRAASGRSPILPISPAASIRARSTSACWKALSPPAPSTPSNRTGRGHSPRSIPCWRPRSARMRTPLSASRSCSAARRRRRRSCVPAVEPWLPAERLQREYDADRLLPLAAIRSTTMPRRSSGCACSPGRNSARAVKAGAGAGRVAGTVVARTERRTKNGTKMGIIGLSDPSGHYEAVLFAEGLAQYRDLLEPGHGRASFPHGRSAGRRSARPHPVGRTARSGGGEDAEGFARILA